MLISQNLENYLKPEGEIYHIPLKVLTKEIKERLKSKLGRKPAFIIKNDEENSNYLSLVFSDEKGDYSLKDDEDFLLNEFINEKALQEPDGVKLINQFIKEIFQFGEEQVDVYFIATVPEVEIFRSFKDKNK